MKRSVFGLVKSKGEAELVVSRLKNAGFSGHDISVLFPNETEKEFDEFGREHTKAPEGAATGGTTGFVVGGVLGWLAGIGSLAIPGLGPFIAAGPILAALSGAAVGAAVGGLTGALIGMGIPEHEAKRYEERLREGNALISIHADDEEGALRAREVLEGVKAEEIATSGEVEWPHHRPVTPFSHGYGQAGGIESPHREQPPQQGHDPDEGRHQRQPPGPGLS